MNCAVKACLRVQFRRMGKDASSSKTVRRLRPTSPDTISLRPRRHDRVDALPSVACLIRPSRRLLGLIGHFA
jgi:hypothetical protein